MPSTNAIREKLRGYSPHERQFMEAEELANSIFTHRAPAAIQVISTSSTYYVDHGINHTQRVIAKLNDLNDLLRSHDQMNQKEAFTILVSAYYHDMGLFIGRISGEEPRTTREEHHIRSAEIVQKLNDRGFLHIPHEELDSIKKVIQAHRVIDLTQLPTDQRITGLNIKTRLLGALLRIADACDCDRSRAPKSIFDLFYEDIPENSREHWRNLFHVTDVTFEVNRAAIVVSFNFSGNSVERIRKFRLGNLLKKKLEKELKSVEKVFFQYGIPLARVEIRDFGSGEFMDFSSMFTSENTVIVTLCSDFVRVDELVAIVNNFVSDTPDGVRLIVEFRPPEGPLFINTGLNIDSNRLDEMKLELEEALGPDLWRVSGEVVEKITIRSGVAT